jgi:hypothetical protein
MQKVHTKTHIQQELCQRDPQEQSINLIEELQEECNRGHETIARCGATPTTTFARIWLRGLMKRREQAIAQQDAANCLACLNELRDIEPCQTRALKPLARR